MLNLKERIKLQRVQKAAIPKYLLNSLSLSSHFCPSSNYLSLALQSVSEGGTAREKKNNLAMLNSLSIARMEGDDAEWYHRFGTLKIIL